MPSCRGIARTTPLSAPRLDGAWDHLIVFSFSRVWANLVLVNTAAPAQLMCADLQGWGLLGASTLGGKCYCIHVSIGISITAPFIMFFPPHLFLGLLLFLGLFKKKNPTKNSEFLLTQKSEQCLELGGPVTNAVQRCCWEQPPIATFSSKAKNHISPYDSFITGLACEPFGSSLGGSEKVPLDSVFSLGILFYILGVFFIALSFGFVGFGCFLFFFF